MPRVENGTITNTASMEVLPWRCHVSTDVNETREKPSDYLGKEPGFQGKGTARIQAPRQG